MAVLVFGMPPGMAAASALYGMAYGLLPIGWIILNVIFLYRLTEEKGLFRVLQGSLTAVTRDRRLQLVLVAFCFGAFLEGAAGFGTPVAVSASLLIGLGFPALAAAGLSLIANTAPVPFAGLGTPLVALQAVTGLDLRALTAAVALQLSFFDLLIPFWLVWAFAGWAAMLEVWPALLVAGGSFAAGAVPGRLAARPLAGQHRLLAGLHGRAGAFPARLAAAPHLAAGRRRRPSRRRAATRAREVLRAWTPWLILSAAGLRLGAAAGAAPGWTASRWSRSPCPGLHLLALRMPPIVAQPRPEPAVFELAWLSASGTAILLAALAAGLWMGLPPGASCWRATPRPSARCASRC